MNAVDPAGAKLHSDDYRSTDRAITAPAVRLLRGLALPMVMVAATLAALRLLPPYLALGPVLAALRGTSLASMALAALLVALAGVTGTGIMAVARHRAASPPRPPMRSRWRRLVGNRRFGDPDAIGVAARWPQAIGVSVFAIAAASCAWWPPSVTTLPVLPQINFALGIATIVLTFPLLIAERLVAAEPEQFLPEAEALRTLLLVAVLCWPLLGLARIAVGTGLPFVKWIDLSLAVVVTAIAAELVLHALARCFLPPPEPDVARAAINTVLTRVIVDGLRERSLAAPIRDHLGIDFSRSWALAYLRSAMPPVAVLLLLLCWGLSGVILVGIDQRAVYERFGAPVAILHPGLHALLPWPMGGVHRVEFGPLHETTLSGVDQASLIGSATAGAEDLPPPSADRLWEQAHPGELDFLIASPNSFQVVSADIKLRYRVGLTDRDALRAAYSTVDPVMLLRGVAGRVLARFFAARTLDEVLGENREQMAEMLRPEVQQTLDAAASGLDLTAIAIEAIHPPAGAAEAYHNVQAAEIMADASIAAERGRAAADYAKAQQYAEQILAQTSAAAAETTEAAKADMTRFIADHAADSANAESFRIERWMTAIAAGLAKSSATIIDHRIPADNAPILDLRPLSPVTARSTGHDQE